MAEVRANKGFGRFDRRQALKGLLGLAIGTATGGAAHGFLYERHDLEVTRSAFPVAGLPEALRGLRIGFLTDIHRSQTVSHEMVTRAVDLLMAERPDLIVLGGDYVTLRRSPLRASGGGGARAAVGAARRLRHSRQSRRRPGHAGGAGVEGLHRAEGRAHAPHGPRRGDGLRAASATGRTGSSISRT